jgi:hypothetical protein
MVAIETKKIIIQLMFNPKKTLEYVNQDVKVFFLSCLVVLNFTQLFKPFHSIFHLALNSTHTYTTYWKHKKEKNMHQTYTKNHIENNYKKTYIENLENTNFKH